MELSVVESELLASAVINPHSIAREGRTSTDVTLGMWSLLRQMFRVDLVSSHTQRQPVQDPTPDPRLPLELELQIVRCAVLGCNITPRLLVAWPSGDHRTSGTSCERVVLHLPRPPVGEGGGIFHVCRAWTTECTVVILREVLWRLDWSHRQYHRSVTRNRRAICFQGRSPSGVLTYHGLIRIPDNIELMWLDSLIPGRPSDAPWTLVRSLRRRQPRPALTIRVEPDKPGDEDVRFRMTAIRIWIAVEALRYTGRLGLWGEISIEDLGRLSWRIVQLWVSMILDRTRYRDRHGHLPPAADIPPLEPPSVGTWSTLTGQVAPTAEQKAVAAKMFTKLAKDYNRRGHAQ